jgi:hypothetical protein
MTLARERASAVLARSSSRLYNHTHLTPPLLKGPGATPIRHGISRSPQQLSPDPAHLSQSGGTDSTGTDPSAVLRTGPGPREQGALGNTNLRRLFSRGACGGVQKTIPFHLLPVDHSRAAGDGLWWAGAPCLLPTGSHAFDESRSGSISRFLQARERRVQDGPGTEPQIRAYLGRARALPQHRELHAPG